MAYPQPTQANEWSIEQAIAQRVPTALYIQLHVLPAHQEFIAPLPTGYVGPVMQEANQWLQHHGYRTLGPWMISWAANGQPQLRRPVSGALKAVQDKTFSTIEVPEQLLVAVPFTGWPVLPHNFVSAINAVGLEMIGTPLLLALSKEPPTIAWVPVIPRGTRTLFQRPSSKLGLRASLPKAGVALGFESVLHHIATSFGRLIAIITMFMYVPLICFIMIVGVLTGEIPLGITDIFVGSLVGLGFLWLIRLFIFFAALIFVFVIGLVKWGAIRTWNKFWSDRPTPPELLLGSRGEGQVGSWMG